MSKKIVFFNKQTIKKTVMSNKLFIQFNMKN